MKGLGESTESIFISLTRTIFVTKPDMNYEMDPNKQFPLKQHCIKKILPGLTICSKIVHQLLGNTCSGQLYKLGIHYFHLQDKQIPE